MADKTGARSIFVIGPLNRHLVFFQKINHRRRKKAKILQPLCQYTVNSFCIYFRIIMYQYISKVNHPLLPMYSNLFSLYTYSSSLARRARITLLSNTQSALLYPFGQMPGVKVEIPFIIVIPAGCVHFKKGPLVCASFVYHPAFLNDLKLQ